jgi:gamma-tubulin complex component 2
MVKSDDNLSRDTLARDFNAQYWEGKYGLVSRNIPSFISSHAAKVLVAGKYLTVVRDLNPFNSTMMHEYNGSSSAIKKDVVTHLENSDLNKSSLSIDEDESMNDLKVTRILFDLNNPEELHLSIDRCYRYSSHALLSLLEQQYSLSLHLRSLRRFFLLEHGDFFTQFMDIAQGELSKEVKDIRLSRIQVMYKYTVFALTFLILLTKLDLYVIVLYCIVLYREIRVYFSWRCRLQLC